MAEPRLHDFTDSDGLVPLHHYATANGDPDELTLDVSRFGESPWSKAEKKAEPTPKVFFYLDPGDKESFLGGRRHYGTHYPADKIYDLMADPKRIVSRIAARPPFNLTKVLNVVRRLGYHGVFYGSSFPTVAMLRNTKVTKRPETPTKLARPEVPRTRGGETVGPIVHPLPGGAGTLTLTRTRISPFHGPTWTIQHNQGKQRVFSGPEFASWVRRLPTAHRESVTSLLRKHLGQTRLARIENTRDVSDLIKHIATNHLHPADLAHGMLADALQDAGDPRAQIVRHSYNEARTLGESDPWRAQLSLEDNEWRRARQIADIPPTEAHTAKYAGIPIPGQYQYAFVFHHRGPTGKHAFDVRYTFLNSPTPHQRPYAVSYQKAMNPQEFREWLNTLDPEQKKALVNQLKKRAGKTRLGRSGYGYCPECKAPFIHHDKEKHLVICPNGHKRRYIKSPKLRLAATRAPSGGAIVNNQYHVGGQFLPRAFKRIARVVQDHERTMRTRALKLSRNPADPAPKKLARMQNTSDIHGLVEHIATNHLHPADLAHGMLADALQDAGDPRAQIVRHSYNEARKIGMSDAFNTQFTHLSKEWTRARQLAGASVGPSALQGIRTAYTFLSPEDMGNRGHDYEVKHWRGPDGKHSFLVTYDFKNDPVPGTRDGSDQSYNPEDSRPFRSAYTSYRQAMTPEEFYEWFRQIDPDQKDRIIKGLSRRLDKTQLKRSGLTPERVLSPEDQHSIRGPLKKEHFEGLVHQAVTNDPASPLPTTKELKTLGEVGESTRGQYAHTGRILTKFIGADNAKLFAAANAILSPLAPWEHHSRASMRLLRLWREAGSPTDPASVKQIVVALQPGKGERDTAGKSIYGSVNFGAKAKRLQHMLMNPKLYIKAIENVAGPKRGKIVDFGRAHFNPNGIPIDTHQAKLTVPHELQDGTHVSHDLVRKIAASGDRRIQNALLEAQKRFIDDPAVYNAYKVALAHAADELGWEPRELQETVWTAAVSLVAARNLGIPPRDILKHLTHEDAFHAWNVGGLLTKPEAKSDVESLTRRRKGTFEDQANLPPSAEGKISVGDPATLENVASRISPSRQTGAWKPVQQSIRDRRQPKLF